MTRSLTGKVALITGAAKGIVWKVRLRSLRELRRDSLRVRRLASCYVSPKAR